MYLTVFAVPGWSLSHATSRLITERLYAAPEASQETRHQDEESGMGRSCSLSLLDMHEERRESSSAWVGRCVCALVFVLCVSIKGFPDLGTYDASCGFIIQVARAV